MKILFIEPYYGGSHKAFIDRWQALSRHQFQILTLPANKWKWRMRHSAIYFAKLIAQMPQSQRNWDCLICSDMLNLAEFLGLANQILPNLPKITYFHENQLTYPQRFESERDYQYVMTNFTTAAASDAVWFNSGFHRDEFLANLKKFLKKMPDNQPLDEIDRIYAKSDILYPGVDLIGKITPKNAPLTILWAGRWEHDKNPEDFFAALKILKDKGIDFGLNVIGEQFRDQPEIFDWAQNYFKDNIRLWGYQPSKQAYYAALRQSDIVVSTAIHEFFGIGMLEAISAGAVPLLPSRLSYPELLTGFEKYLYDGSIKDLADRLQKMLNQPELIQSMDLTEIAKRFSWQNQAQKLDSAAENVKKNLQ